MIVVTGATGRTGRRVTEVLLAKGEQVRAVGRNGNKLARRRLGAEPFVADVADVDSMAACFADVSAVYLVLPEDLSQQDLSAHQESVSDCYAAAISKAHVPFVVNLSSMGARIQEKRAPLSVCITKNTSSIKSQGSMFFIFGLRISWKTFS